jgi:hypothetical protein
MALTVTAVQRDALYDRIVDRLSGIGDIWLAAESKDYETADRLGREYSDELRLLLDDLGWGGSLAESRPVVLKTPPDVLRRVFGRLRESTATERAAEATRWAESEMLEQRNRLVGEACDNVLRMLGDMA